MRISMKLLLAACLGSSVFLPRAAHASTDLPGQYDARSVGLGGTGVSYVENGASIFLNPATLDGVSTFAGTFTLSPIQPTLTTPVTGPGSSVKSDSSFFPLFLLGAGLRLSDRIVVGLALYPTAGMGSSYTGVAGGDDLKFSLAQFEVSPAASVKIIDGLSVGLGYRITYTSQTAHFPAMGPMASATDLKLSGTNFAGFHLGVYYRPTDDLHLGLSYRSRVTSSLSGTTEVMGTKLDTTSEFGTPDRFKLGASYSLLDKKLLVAADVKYLLYANSNKSLDTTVTTPLGPATSSQAMDWKNVFGVGFGVEGWVNPLVAVRAGYDVSQSATPDSTASPFTQTPGLLHGLHAGAGIKLPSLDLDAGALYSFGSKHLDGSPTVAPGDYKMSTILFSLGATYHM